MNSDKARFFSVNSRVAVAPQQSGIDEKLRVSPKKSVFIRVHPWLKKPFCVFCGYFYFFYFTCLMGY